MVSQIYRENLGLPDKLHSPKMQWFWTTKKELNVYNENLHRKCIIFNLFKKLPVYNATPYITPILV